MIISAIIYVLNPEGAKKMNNVIKKLNRAVSEYEFMFQENFDEVKENMDFYIGSLKEAIEHTDNAIDKYSTEISDLADIIRKLYLNYEASTIFEKIKLARLKIIANRKYMNLLVLHYEAKRAKERLETLLKRLKLLKCF